MVQQIDTCFSFRIIKQLIKFEQQVYFYEFLEQVSF